MNIRSVRIPITILGVIVCLFDLLIIYKTWTDKLWKGIVASEEGGFRVVSIWHWSDTIILIAIVLLQIGLAYVAYRSWTSRPEGRSGRDSSDR
jgi:hypothetical protein